MKISLRYLFTAILLLALLNSCRWISTGGTEIIRIKGSDTMLKLARTWAAEYMETHSGVSIYVEGGGSATGLKSLAAGTADIALASRLINSSEIRLLGERYKQLGVNFLVAKDALSVYLNPENPVSDLSMDQLRDIFSGHITNWKQVGGFDEEIVVVLRPPTSGSYYYIKSYVLDNDAYTKNAVTMPTTNSVSRYISKNKNAIGYGGIAHELKIKHSHINGVAAVEENVRFFKYPLTRYLYLYTPGKPQGAIKDFIDWVLSPSGQRIVREMGFMPLWEEQ